MSEAKWVKIRIDMYDHPKLKIIDDMKSKNLVHYIWTSSLLLAGRCNRSGELYLSDDMPYTIKTLAVVFRRTEEEVKEAYKVLKKLKMIVVTEDRAFKIKSWEKYQNVDGLEKIRKQTNERVAKYREKKREEKRAEEEQKKIEEINECEAKDENYSVKSSDEDLDNKENPDIESSDEKDSNNDTYNNFDINNSNVTCNDEANVTCNKLSVTETQQNKIENKKRSKNKIEKERDNNKSLSVSEDIYSKSIELAQYCEKITGKIGILNNDSLNMVVDMHGSENVKKAIQKAVEQGKVNMRYINGILKNWRKEGYPKEDMGGINYGGKCTNKSNESDTFEFRTIKPKEPRRLSEEERNRIRESVI